MNTASGHMHPIIAFIIFRRSDCVSPVSSLRGGPRRKHDALGWLPPSNHGPVIWRDLAVHLVAARGRLSRGFHRVARM
jgi:hypothetical protein